MLEREDWMHYNSSTITILWWQMTESIHPRPKEQRKSFWFPKKQRYDPFLSPKEIILDMSNLWPKSISKDQFKIYSNVNLLCKHGCQLWFEPVAHLTSSSRCHNYCICGCKQNQMKKDWQEKEAHPNLPVLVLSKTGTLLESFFQGLVLGKLVWYLITAWSKEYKWFIWRDVTKDSK